MVVKWLLLALGQEVVSQPIDLLLGTSQFAVEIYPACAGYEGIGLMTVFVGSYLWLFRRGLRFPHAFILLPFGILIIWLVNALRIASLVLFGTYVSPQIALGGFHSSTGWLGFIAVALSMVAVTQRNSFFTAGQTDLKANVRENNLTAAYLGPLMALLAVTMVTGMFSSGFDWLSPARVIGTGAVIWFFWRRSMTRSEFAFCWSWGTVGIGVAVFGIWIGLEWAMGGPDTGSSISKTLGESPAGLAAVWIVFRLIGSVVTVPIAEELAFRGYLLRRLISVDFDKLSPRFTWLSFLLSSFLFGALHGRWLAGTAAGMLFAWAMYRRGRGGGAIIDQVTTDAMNEGNVLVFGD